MIPKGLPQPGSSRVRGAVTLAVTFCVGTKAGVHRLMQRKKAVNCGFQNHCGGLSLKPWAAIVRRIACLLLAAGGSAFACPICAPSDARDTLLYQLQAADAAVLAVPGDRGTVLRAVEWLKGPQTDRPLPVLPQRALETAPGAGIAVLLLYRASTREWRPAGNLPLARAGWLKRVMELRSTPPTDGPGWNARLALFGPDLEHAEPLIARTAYEEVAQAPYGAMRSLKSHVSAAQVRRWVSDPLLARRRPLYALLLGFVGAEPDALRLVADLPSAPSGIGVPELSALFAAILEIRGVAGVLWLETHYLAGPGRTEAEIQAAVLALGVHANDGMRLPRARVVAAYQTLVRGNPAHAGIVASDLATWGNWEFGSQFAGILRSGVPMAFASRYAMVFFLLRSPRAQDREALQALRAANLL